MVNRAMLSVCLILFSCYGVSAQDLDRYYSGIGARYWQIAEETIKFWGQRNGLHIEFDNERGACTGHIVVGEIMAGGPAERAGLERGDMIIQIDNENVSSPDAVSSKIRSKRLGENVNLRVRRMDEKGENYHEYTLVIRVETIDRADWVNYDFPSKGSWGGSWEGSKGATISYESGVSRTGDGGFIYYYDFTNNAGEVVVLHSEIINLLLRKDGDHETQYYLVMNPGRTTSFALETKDFPVEEVPSSFAQYFSSVALPELYAYFLENYPDTDSNKYFKDSTGLLWLNTMGVRNSFFVPSRWVVQLLEKDTEFWDRK